MLTSSPPCLLLSHNDFLFALVPNVLCVMFFCFLFVGSFAYAHYVTLKTFEF